MHPNERPHWLSWLAAQGLSEALCGLPLAGAQARKARKDLQAPDGGIAHHLAEQHHFATNILTLFSYSMNPWALTSSALTNRTTSSGDALSPAYLTCAPGRRWEQWAPRRLRSSAGCPTLSRRQLCFLPRAHHPGANGSPAPAPAPLGGSCRAGPRAGQTSGRPCSRLTACRAGSAAWPSPAGGGGIHPRHAVA